MLTHNWLWVDLETTGLDEHAGQILEVACAVVDDGPDGTFGVLDSVETVVLTAEKPAMDDYVREMHTRNGLLALIARGEGVPLGEADEMCRAFVDTYCGGPREKVVLAGGSVHFDLRWINRHMPRFAERCHYRVFDVSTLKAAARVWGPGFENIKSDKHRAMYDVQASVKEAKAYLDLVRA